MFFSKQGVAPHLIVLGVVSVVMGLFLLLILSSFYQADPEKCETLSFEISDFCRNGNEVQVSVENLAESPLKIQINSLFTEDYLVSELSKATLVYDAEGESEVRAIPLVNDGVETLQCRGKLKKAVVGEMGRC